MAGRLDDIQLNIVVTLQGNQNLSSATSALQRLNGAADQVRSNASAVVSVNRNQIKSWQDLTEQLGDVERRYDAIFRAGVHMSQMGNDLIGMSREIADTARNIVDAYEDYDMMLRRGATALNTNTEWQGKLDSAIQGTARAVGLFSPKEVAEGYYIWGAAAGTVVDSQKKLDEITSVVTDTMIATAMAGGTLEGNLNGVYAVLSQFNLPTSQASDVIKTLGLMTERTAAQFPDLINSLSYIGPLADSLGISFEDVTSILGLLADAGQKGSRAGRGLAMVIEGMSAPSGPAGDALDGLIQRTHGLSAAWGDVIFPKGEFMGMRDMLIEMALAAQDMTDAERGRFYATAFTNNATRALIPLIEDQIKLNKDAAASGKEYTSVLDQEKYAISGAGDFFEIMKSQALGSITAIKGRLEASFFPALQMIATTIMEMALPTIEWMGDLADKFGVWVKQNPELVKMAVQIAAITAAVLAGAGVLLSFGGALLYAIGNIGVFVQGIGRVLGPFGALGIMIGTVATAVYENVGGIRDAIGNFVDAVSGFISAVIGDGSTFQAAWEEIWNGVKGIVEGALTVIAGALNELAGWFRELSKNEAVVSFVREAVTIFIKFRGALMLVTGVMAGLWAAGRALSFFMGILKMVTGIGMVISMLKNLALAFQAVRAAFAVGGLISGIQALITVLGGGFLVTIGGVIAALSPVILIIGAIVAVVAGLFVAWQTNFLGIRDIVANVWDFITNFVSDVLANVGTFVSGVIDWFAHLPGTIGQFLSDSWNAVTKWIGDIVSAIGDFIGSVTKAIGDFLADIGENWAYYLGYILGYVIGWIANILKNVIGFLVALIGGIVEWLSKAPGEFAKWFGQVWTNTTKWFGDLITNVAKWMADVIGKIVEWISKAPGRFMEWLGKTWESVSTWFHDLFISVGTWMSDIIGHIVDWVRQLPGRAITAISVLADRLKTFFTELPGKIWQTLLDVGGQIIAGVWAGIQAAWQGFWDNVHNFFSGIVDGVKDALGIESPSKVFAEIGRYMIDGMAVGISSEKSALNALDQYTDNLSRAAAGTNLSLGSLGSDSLFGTGGLSVTSDNTKVVRIEMDITSSDGSVDSLTLEQLRAAVTGSELITALEHAAEAA